MVDEGDLAPASALFQLEELVMIANNRSNDCVINKMFLNWVTCRL